MKASLRIGLKKPPQIWRNKNAAFTNKHVTKTAKDGRESVMVWEYTAASGVGNLVFIKSKEYSLKQIVEKLGQSQNCMFQQDNDPKPISKIVKE